MSNIDIRFYGTGNFAGIDAQVKSLMGQFAALNAEMKKASTAGYVPGGTPSGGAYNTTLRQIGRIRAEYQAAAGATGMFETSQARITSQTQEFTKALQKQKLSLGQILRQMPVAKAAYQEQLRMQRAYANIWGRDARGNLMADLVVPKGTAADLDTLRTRLSWVAAEAKSAGQQMVNWGKNTQWAGRQLMTGFTFPMVALGVATGVTAYKVDQNLTRIAKVYDTTTRSQLNSQQQVQDQQNQLDIARQQSFDNAVKIAQQYGASINDTLDATAQLAATGLTGAELMGSTAAAMRIATLGEMDYNDAVNATISLQSVFRLSARQTKQAFDYINAVENATSLTMQDFAQAIPIAAGPIKDMGGNIEDLGLALVAMRERGVSAIQGANAIKSAMQRLLNPTTRAVDQFEQLTGRSLPALIQQTHGNFIPTMKALSDSLQGVSEFGRKQFLTSLFGAWQRTRLNDILEGMQDLENHTGQIWRAQQMGSKTAIQLAAIANTEIAQQANSLSGKLRRVWATLQAQAAQIGRVFLEIGVHVIDVLGKVFEAFNSLPDGVKKVAVVGAIFTALVGPVVMLTGLFVNFTGTLVKTGGFLAGLAGNLKIVSENETLANAASQIHQKTLTEEAQSTMALTTSIQGLTDAYIAATAAAQGLSTAEMRAVVFGGTHRAPGAAGIGTSAAGYQGRRIAGAPGAEPDPQSRRNWLGIAGAMTAVGVASGLIAMNTEGAAHNMAEMVFWASLLLPAFQALSVPWGLLVGKIGVAGTAIRDFAVTQAFLANVAISRVMVGGWAAIGAAIARAGVALKSFLLIGGGVPLVLTAAAVAAYTLWKHTKDIHEEAAAAYTDVKGLGDIYGYAAESNATFVDASGKVVQNSDSIQSRSAEIAKNYGSVVQRIKDADGEQNKLNAAMNLGLRVISSGGTAEQARQAVLDGLYAAGEKAKEYAVHFKADLDFTNAENVMRQFLTQASLLGLNTADLSADKDKSWLAKIGDKVNSATDFFNPAPPGYQNPDPLGIYPDYGALSADAQTQGKAAGESYWNGWLNAGNDPQSQSTVLQSLQGFLTSLNTQITNETDAEQKKRLEVYRQLIIDSILAPAGKDVSNLANGLTDATNAFDVLNTLSGHVSVEAERQFLIMKQQNQGLNASESLRLIQLNLQKAINAEERKQKKNVDDVNSGLSHGVTLTKDQLDVWKQYDWAEAQKTIMSGTQDAVADAMGRAFQASMEARMKAVQDAGQAALDAIQRQRDQGEAQFDREQRRMERRQQNAQDALTKKWDDRKAAVQSEIDAEQKADDVRQRIFDAEMARLSRLAEAQNRNIDFNIALSSGNLDEAARIRNDAQAAAAGWDMQDQQDAMGRRSQRRQDVLQSRLDDLDKVEQAEQKALDRRQERRQRELEQERRHWEKMMDVREAAQQSENEINVEQEQAFEESRQRAFEAALEALRSYIPKNRRDLVQHINDIEREYGDFGGVMTTKGKLWAEVIGTALKQQAYNARSALRSDIDWAGIGEDSARKWIRGALGMTPQQFRKYFNLPQIANRQNGPAASGNLGGGYNPTGSQGGPRVPGVAHHDGGPVGRITGRTGYPASAKPFPSERWLLAKDDEYVISGSAHRKYGTRFFNRVNTGGFNEPDSIVRHDGGPVGNIGLPGITAGGIMGQLQRGVFRKLADMAAQRAVSAVTGAIGGAPIYGGKGADGRAYMDGEPLSNIAAAQIRLAEKLFKTNLSIMQGGWQAPSSYSGTSHTWPGVADVGPGNFTTQRMLRRVGFAAWGRNFPGAATAGSGPHVHAVSMIDPGNYQSSAYQSGAQPQIASYKAGGDGLGGSDYGPRPDVLPNLLDMLPKFARGVFVGNDGWAQLHRGEAVIPEVLSRQFERGVENLASGGGDEYSITVVATDGMDVEAVANKVMEKIRFEKGRKGTPRRVTGE